MSTAWTNEERYELLLRGKNNSGRWGHGVTLEYGGNVWYDGLESAIHEISHAVCLDLHRGRRRQVLFGQLTALVSRTLGGPPYNNRRAGDWQEIKALAAEVVVLKKLNIRLWNATVKGAANSGAAGNRTEAGLLRVVKRATHWKTTQRRAKVVLELLDELCERGKMIAK